MKIYFFCYFWKTAYQITTKTVNVNLFKHNLKHISLTSMLLSTNTYTIKKNIFKLSQLLQHSIAGMSVSLYLHCEISSEFIWGEYWNQPPPPEASSPCIKIENPMGLHLCLLSKLYQKLSFIKYNLLSHAKNKILRFRCEFIFIYTDF